MRLLLDRGGQFLVAQAAKPLGVRRRRDPDDAGAIAGQGHEHARAMRRVELGRDVAMGPRVADVEGQRRLGQLAPRHRDAGGFAAKRMPAVGADHEAGREKLRGGRADRDVIGFDDDSFGLVIETDETGQLGRARFQRQHQRAVVDVVAEGIEADFVAGEPDLGARGTAGRCRRRAA